MTQIHTLPALKDNFIYLLVSPDGRRAAAVDPGEAAPVRHFLSAHDLKLTHVLCTHHHWDHVNGVPELAALSGCEVVCSAHDLYRIPGATRAVSDGETLRLWDTVELRVLATPGHTQGQIALWFAEGKALFTGDTLFSGGCGRLFEGTAEEMFASLKRLSTLPGDTLIHFGHEYTLKNMEFVLATAPTAAARAHYDRCVQRRAAGEPTAPVPLATEMEINPFLRAVDVEEFRRFREARDQW